MGLLDEFAGMLQGGIEQIDQDAGAKVTQELMARTSLGLQGLVTQFRQSGLGQHVDSWVSEGENMAVTTDHVYRALGSGQLNEIARQLGVTPDSAAQFLARHLPNAVSQAAQQGQVQ